MGLRAGGYPGSLAAVMCLLCCCCSVCRVTGVGVGIVVEVGVGALEVKGHADGVADDGAFGDSGSVMLFPTDPGVPVQDSGATTDGATTTPAAAPAAAAPAEHAEDDNSLGYTGTAALFLGDIDALCFTIWLGTQGIWGLGITHTAHGYWSSGHLVISLIMVMTYLFLFL